MAATARVTCRSTFLEIIRIRFIGLILFSLVLYWIIVYYFQKPTSSTIELELADFSWKSDGRYKPSWTSLDSRPLPTWYDSAKIGIFLHWGVFSVPSFEDAWFWYWWKGPMPRDEFVKFMKKNYPPTFSYPDFAPDLTAEFYDPYEWVEIFKASGAKYVVITSKHHEGFCMWPTNHSFNWNAMDIGPKRDLIGDLAKAVRDGSDLKFGIYHSLYEFFNPLLMEDESNNFTTQEYVHTKIIPSLHELIHKYKPDLLWSDGPWKAEDSYWNAKDFLAWLYNESPVKDQIVTNDRWGRNTPCKHGGYMTCKDHFNPKILWPRKFEDSTTLTKRGWSFQRNLNLSSVHSMEHMTKLIAQVVSCGGNLLINVGPTKDGVIVPIFEERLRQMGDWLRVNGEAIYSSTPWTFQNDTENENVWFTQKAMDTGEIVVYAILLKWPDSGEVLLASPVPDTVQTEVTMLGLDLSFPWSPREDGRGGMIVRFPFINYRRVPCKWAWVLRLTHIRNVRTVKNLTY